jgi:hypothetical protein
MKLDLRFVSTRLGLTFVAFALFGAPAAPVLADEGVPAGEIEVPTTEAPPTLPNPPVEESEKDLWSFRVPSTSTSTTSLPSSRRVRPSPRSRRTAIGAPCTGLRIEPMAGFRYTYFQADVKVKDALIPEHVGRKLIQVKENWWQLLPLGVEVELGLSENLSLLSSVMLGGGDIGDSKSSTDGVGDLLLKYRMPSTSLPRPVCAGST